MLAGQKVGVEQVGDKIWLVTFMEYDLGFFDKDEGRIEPAPNPFAPDKVLTVCPEYTLEKWRARRDSNSRPPGSKPGTLSS